MSEKFTQFDIDRINARRSKPATGGEPVGEGVEDESDLHAEIAQECRRRGWLAVHSRMDARTTTALGVVDFIIFRENHGNALAPTHGPSSVLLIECKARSGKLTVVQNAWHAHARKLGHEVFIVRDFAQFLTLL